jgi:hypothetical protein
MLILVKCLIFVLYRKSNRSEKFDRLSSGTSLNLDQRHLIHWRIKGNDTMINSAKESTA